MSAIAARLRPRRALSALLVGGLLAVGALAPAAASAAPGELDPTFGVGGTERIFPSHEETSLNGVAVQPDGRIVLAGSTGFEESNLFVVRLLEDGALDPGFGSGGVVLSTLPGFSEGRAVAIQPDGKIVVAGEAAGTKGNGDFLAARFLPDGAPDPSFGGGDGVETVPVGAGQDRAEALAIGAGGRILLTGEARLAENKGDTAGVAVLKPNGEPDPAFSTDGVTTINTTGKENADEGTGIVEQPDGKIVISDATGDGAGNGFTVVRLLAGGTLDPAFGEEGVAVTPIPGSAPGGRATGLVLQPDGRIVAAGYGFDDDGMMMTESKFAAVRYLGNGELDPTFGGEGAGIFSHEVAAGDDDARAVFLTPAGKLVLAGSYDPESGSGHSPAAMRLVPDGVLDPTFGSGGVVVRGVTAPFGETYEGSALDAEERLVIVSKAFLGGGDTSVVVTRFLGDRPPKIAPSAPPVAPPAPKRADRAPRARLKAIPAKVAAAKLKGFSGTAGDDDGDAVVRVQIAVDKFVSGGSKSARASKGAAAKACLEMKNAKGSFRRGKARKGAACPLVWLTAKGTAKWSFKLKAGLSPGRYLVYARAVGADGTTEPTFSRRAGDRYAFRVLAAAPKKH